MNSKFSFATIMKDFGKRNPSQLFLLSEKDEVIPITLSDISKQPTTLFFHDTSLLIDEYIGSTIEYPLNIADVTHLSLTIGTFEDKPASKLRSDISRLLSNLADEEKSDVNYYLSAFWGGASERTDSDKLLRAITGFLKQFRASTLALLSNSHNGQAVERFLTIEQPAATILANITVSGIPYNNNLVQQKRKTVEKQLYLAIKELSDATGIAMSFPNDSDKARILKQFINDGIHIDQVDNQIEMLAEAHPAIKTLSTVVKAQHELHIFKKIPTSDTKLHPIFEPYGTTTGRILCKDPEIQNISKANRDILKTPAGHSFLYIDYEQFEAGILGDLSQCRELIEMYNSSDIYNEIAMTVFNDKQARSFAKVLFLAYSYGMEQSSLRKMCNRHAKGSAALLDNFLLQFERISQWKQELYEGVLENHSISTVFAGKKYFKLQSEGLTPKQQRSIVSQTVQGTGSLIFKHALVNTFREIESYGRVIMPMHDALLLLCPTDRASEASQAAARCMKAAFKQWCPSIEPKVSISDYFKDCRTNTVEARP
jgi:DNA polymerase-1